MDGDFRRQATRESLFRRHIEAEESSSKQDTGWIVPPDSNSPVCDQDFDRLLAWFSIVFVVDDAMRDFEQQHKDVAEAVTQFTANHFNKPNTGIDLYIMCSDSRVAVDKAEYLGQYSRLQEDGVRNVFDKGKTVPAQVSPDIVMPPRYTVCDIIRTYVKEHRVAAHMGFHHKPLLLITMSSEVPWKDPESLVKQVHALNALQGLLLQVSLHAVQVRRGKIQVENHLENEVEIKEEELRMKEWLLDESRIVQEWDRGQDKLEEASIIGRRRSMFNVVRRKEIRPGVLTLSAEGIRFMILDHVNTILSQNPWTSLRDLCFRNDGVESDESEVANEDGEEGNTGEFDVSQRIRVYMAPPGFI
ncbi:hypothetical protein E4U43_006352 [Claviceps pusilla]|uniref:Uncharacterized protein n=1 Tax=Claviceps pusilla TaxID=123648 RepID=A0A9P7SZQ3_9HYPO|nr:hypothetical protein E4U43_006352 [Claviceps pusilla]